MEFLWDVRTVIWNVKHEPDVAINRCALNGRRDNGPTSEKLLMFRKRFHNFPKLKRRGIFQQRTKVEQLDEWLFAEDDCRQKGQEKLTWKTRGFLEAYKREARFPLVNIKFLLVDKLNNRFLGDEVITNGAISKHLQVELLGLRAVLLCERSMMCENNVCKNDCCQCKYCKLFKRAK